MSQPYHQEIQPRKQVSKPVNEMSSVISKVVGSTPPKLNGKPSLELLKEMLAIMRALQTSHHTAHWQASEYQLHLLFQRLYESLDDEIDTLGEKMVGLFGPEAVNASDSMNRKKRWIDGWNSGKPLENAIAAEKDFQATVKYTYETLKTNGELTLGMDDFLMTVANNHETNLYLLTRYV